MKGYFFLSSFLPKLQFDFPINFSFDDLIRLYTSNLTGRDMKKVWLMRHFIDLKNVCQFLREEPIDKHGNFSESKLSQALDNQEGFPQYLFDYLEKYQTLEEQIRFFPSVLSHFFLDAQEQSNGFLRYYFDFERKWRLVLTAMRAKKLKIDLSKEFQFEDPRDLFVAELLAQKDTSNFEFPAEFKEMDEALKGEDLDPKEQYKALAEFCFYYILENIQDHPFSIDYLLGYLAQFMIIDNWNMLNEKEGSKRLNQMVQDVG